MMLHALTDDAKPPPAATCQFTPDEERQLAAAHALRRKGDARVERDE